MAQYREVFTADISQIEASLNRLSALQKKIDAQSKSGQASVNFGNIVPPDFGKRLQPLDPSAQLAAIARIQGAIEAAAARAKQLGAISKQQYTELQGVATTFGGVGIPTAAPGAPTGQLINPSTGLPFTTTFSNLSQDDIRRAGFAKRTAKAGVSERNVQGNINRIEALALAQAERNLQIDNTIGAAKQGELLTQQQINEATAKRATALRTKIAQLEAELGLATTGGAQFGTVQELAGAEAALRGRAAVDRDVIRQAAEQQQQAALEQLQLSNPAQLRQDAAEEARIMARRRQIAVIYGRAKQEEYLLQIRHNQELRNDLARESAARQARIAIESKLANEELARVYGYDVNTRQPRRLRDDVVAGAVSDRREETIQGALVQEALAADQEYIAAKIRNAKATATEAALVETALAADQQYLASKVQSAVAQAEEAAAIEAQLATNQQYLAAKAKSARALASESAEIAAENAVNSEYIAAKVKIAQAEAQEAAAVQQTLVANSEYIRNKAATARALAAEQARVAETNIQSAEYIRNKAASARAAAAEAAAVQQINVQSAEYIRNKTTTARVAAEEAALVAAANVANREYLSAKASSARSAALEAAAVSAANVVNREYLAAKASSARSAATEAASVAAANAANAQYIADKASTARSLASERAQIAAENASNQQYLQNKAETARSLEIEKAAIAAENSVNREYIAAKARSAEAQAVENASVGAANAANQQYIAAKVATARAQTAERLAIIRNTTQADVVARGQLANEQALLRDRIKIAELEASSSQQAIQVKTQRILAEREYNAAIRRATLAELKNQGAGLFTRAQYRFGRTGPGSGSEDFGSFAGGGALSTLRYTIPSLALFASAGFLVGTIKEAEELQRSFTVLQGQIDKAFVDSPEQAEAAFGSLRDTILESAKATGVEADLIANAAQQLQGAFGEQSGKTISGLSGQELVDAQTASIGRLALVSGLEPEAITDDVTAISNGFNVLGEEAGNVAVQLKRNLGTAEKDTLDFLGRIAPLAKETGFTMEELATISAQILLESGGSGAENAEKLSRSLASLTQNRTALVELAQLTPALNNPQFLQAVNQGDTRQVFFSIAEQFENMDASAKSIVTNLFGRREAPTLLAAVNDIERTEKNINELNREGNDLQEKSALIAETLSTQFQILGEKIRQAGVELYEAGLGDILERIVEILGLAVSVVDIFASGISAVDDATGGLLSTLLEVYAVVKLIQISGIAGGVGKLVSGAVVPSAAFAGFGTTAGGAAGAGAGAAAGAGAGGLGAAFAAAGGGLAGLRAAGAALPAIVPLAIAGASVYATYNRFNDEEADVQKAQKALTDRLSEATDEQVRAIAQSRTDLVDRIAINYFSEDLPEELAQKELFRRQAESGINFLAEANQQGQLGNYLESVQAVINQEREAGRSLALEEFLSQPGADDYGFLNDKGQLDLTEVTAADLEELRGKASQGDQIAAGILYQLGEVFANDQRLAGIAGEIFGGSERDAAFSEATARAEEASLTLEAAEAGYQAGSVGLQEYLAVKRDYIESLRVAIENQDEADPALLAEYYSERAEEAKIYSEARANQLDLITEINTLRIGEGQASETQIADSIRLLQDPNFADPEARLELANSIIELRRKIRDEAIEEFDSAAEALAFLNANPVQIDPEVRLAFLGAQLNQQNDAWQTFLDTYEAAFDEQGDMFLRNYILSIVAGNLTIEEAKADFQEKIDNIKSIPLGVGGGGAANDLNEQVRAYEAAISVLDSLVDPGPTAAEDPQQIKQLNEKAEQQAEEARREAEQAQREREQEAERIRKEAEKARQEAIAAQNSYYEYLKALYGDDPVRVGQISIEQAQYQLSVAETEQEYNQARTAIVQAERQQRQNFLDIERAKLELVAAQVAGDPVKAAAAAQRQAQFELDNAKGEAERLQAEARKIEADRAVEEAIRAVGDAQTDLLIAIANAAGNTVEATQLSLERARENLRRVREQFARGQAGEADVTAAETAVVQEQAAERDAILNQRTEQYAFLYEMDRINKSQYIQYLEQLKQMPDLTEDQIRDLERQIKRLRGELGQDLQFNLPTNLNLPTVYETRRVAQGGGVGYQDNRQVQLNVNIASDVDAGKVLDVINEAIGVPLSGTIPKRY